MLDIDESGGKKAAQEIVEYEGKAKFYLCDVTSNADCKKVAETIYKEFGSINILVNCTGVIIRKDIVELSEKEWDFVIGVDLKGVYLLSHHVIPYMKKEGGSIINIGSGWGLKGGPKATAYCAKGGVHFWKLEQYRIISSL